MKNFIFLTAFSFIAQLAISQNIIDDHFNHLKNLDNATQITIDGKLFSMANSFKDNEDENLKELADFLSTVTGFSAIGFEQLSNAHEEYKNGLDIIKLTFEELMQIKSNGTNFSLYIDEKDGIVRELVGIGHEKEKFGIFSLSGEMALKQIGKMASEIQMQGFDKIEKIEDYNLSEISVYPNPVSLNGKFTLETSTAFEGGTASIIDASGALIKSIDIDRPSLDIAASDLSAGLYLVEIQFKDISVKKKLIVIE